MPTAESLIENRLPTLLDWMLTDICEDFCDLNQTLRSVYVSVKFWRKRHER